MPKPNEGKTQQVLLGTAHAAGLCGCDPTTLLDNERRGLVTPLKSTTGRRMWRQEDVAAINAYREQRGLPRMPDVRALTERR